MLQIQLYPKLSVLAEKLAVVYFFRAMSVVWRARPGGLEPPTSGFGDLRSTN